MWRMARGLSHPQPDASRLFDGHVRWFPHRHSLGDPHERRSWTFRRSGAGGDCEDHPHLPVFEVQPMDVLVEKGQAGTKFQLLLIGVFAAIAVLLAGVGLYGVLSTMVRQRTSEIGVRMALGAGPGRIFNLVIGHGLRLSAAGSAWKF